MGYKDLIEIQNKLDNTQKLWNKVENCREKFKVCVQDNSKVIFYEDLYNRLPVEDKVGIESPEQLRDNLNMYFKYENTTYHFIKSYKEFVLKKFENGYLWDKITKEIKYNNLYKELEYIDKNKTYKSVIIKYTDLFKVIKKDYAKYLKTKRDMKKVLKVYFDKSNVISVFTDNKDEFENFTTKSISMFNKQYKI